jgi:hypothetical protein
MRIVYKIFDLIISRKYFKNIIYSTKSNLNKMEETNKRKLEEVLGKEEEKEENSQNKISKIEEIQKEKIKIEEIQKEKKKICKFFNTKKGCSDKNCKFIHENLGEYIKENKKGKEKEKLSFKNIEEFEKKYNLKVITKKNQNLKNKNLASESYLILINKDKDITSYDVIRKYKELLRNNNLKCGHSGL